MAALVERFAAVGIRFEPLPGGNLRAFGNLTDELRTAIRTKKPAILAELVSANDGPARRWQVRFSSLDPVEVIFFPEATPSEVRKVYLGATTASLPDLPARKATPAEADELRKLVALVLRDADDTDRAEALAVALTDPDAALTSFRVLAAELQGVPITKRYEPPPGVPKRCEGYQPNAADPDRRPGAERWPDRSKAQTWTPLSR